MSSSELLRSLVRWWQTPAGSDSGGRAFIEMTTLEDRVLYSVTPFTPDVPPPDGAEANPGDDGDSAPAIVPAAPDPSADTTATPAAPAADIAVEDAVHLLDATTGDAPAAELDAAHVDAAFVDGWDAPATDVDPLPVLLPPDASAPDAATPDAAVPDAAMPDAASPEPHRHELVLIDRTLQQVDQLISDLLREDPNRDLDLVYLDGNQDGFAQVDAALAGDAKYDAIHFLTHGDDGMVRLGGSWLDADAVEAHLNQIQHWSDSLTTDADLLFYACDTASAAGPEWLARISDITGADVAASDDRTGHAALGGDWVLEYQHGFIESAAALDAHTQDTWFGTLATYTVTNTSNSGAGSLRQAILDANANSGLDTISFNIAGAGVQTIDLASALPTITDSVILDGWTQTGFSGTPLIELNGTSAGVGADGIYLSASNSTIRGLIINRFNDDGLVIDGGNGNVITGNYIGTNAAGTAASANLDDGIVIANTSVGNVIGGTSATARNVISGNQGVGLDLFGSGAVGNVITGNYIGVNAAGDAAIGNAGAGVLIEASASNNVIGGISAGSANVISGNGQYGLLMTGAGTDGNVIEGNRIGTDATGVSGIGNGLQGIAVQAGALDNRIGGTTAGSGNTIAFNAADGIAMSVGSGGGNAILGNSIYSNGGLGIDLHDDGVTANDLGDADAGANTLQNFPTLTSAVAFGGNTTITGSLNTAAGTYRVEFFSTTASDATGYGEGQTYLGSADVTTDASGNAAINTTLSGVNVSGGSFVTATATLLAGGVSPASTSEFARNISATTSLVNGNETLVNSVTLNTQITSDSYGGADHSIVVAPNGNYVVVWSGLDAAGTNWEVFGRLFDRNGSAIGSQFQINQTVAGSQTYARVAMDDAGKFTVVWQSNNGSTYSIMGRQFAADGTALGGEFTVETTSVYQTHDPGIGMDAAGNFTVIWEADNTGNYRVYAQRYDAAGVTQGGTITVSSGGGSDLRNPSIAMNSAGMFAVDWFDSGLGEFRIFNSAGTALTSDVTIANVGGADKPSIGIDAAGNVAAAWTDGTDAWYRLFSSTGAALTSAARANQTTTGAQGDPSLSRTEGGDFLITWEGNGPGDGAGVFARLFDDSGTALTAEFLVNETTTGTQQFASGAMLDRNNYVVAWSGNGTGDADGVFTRAFGNGAPSNILTVDTVGDTLDGDTSSISTLLANRGADGKISLREAITAANNSDGLDTIVFNISDPLVNGAHTLQPGSALPTITDAVIIDGTTEPDFAGTPIIELNGSLAGSAFGLQIDPGGAGSTIRGLVINRFGLSGLGLYGGNNVIEGNFIGTNVAGTAALGNGVDGVEVFSDYNTIGGTAAGQRNLLSGNVDDGIDLGNRVGNVVQGNYIGSDVTGTLDLGNASDGVLVENSLNARIGGVNPGEGNLIRGNGGIGVNVSSGGSGNAILGNSIFNNGQLGIDLGTDGATANDLDDADTGGNSLQNFPVLTTASVHGSNVVIRGSLNSAAGGTFRVEFFANTVNDNEGQRYLGYTDVTTPGGSPFTVNISAALTASLSAGEFVTATATDAGNNTSEFSATVETRGDIGIWLSTSGATTAGGQTWNNGTIVQLGDPNLALEPGTSNGTLFPTEFDVNAFAADGAANLNGVHYVSRTVVVGGAHAVTLRAGDLLLSTNTDETLGGVAISKNDIVLFRPTSTGDYGSGTFSILLQNPMAGNTTRDFALVEQTTVVGGVTLNAGDFLLTASSATYDKDITRYQVTDVGAGTTSGSRSLFIDGSSFGIGFSAQILGLELVQNDIVLGGKTLAAGQLLLAFNAADMVGNNFLSVTQYDVIALNVTTTGMFISSGSASLVLEGADLGFGAAGEEFDGLALIGYSNTAPILNAARSPVLSGISEDAGTPVGAVGTLISSLVDFAAPAGQVDNVTDADSGSLLGIAVTAADATNGAWYFSTDNGANWSALGSVSDASARLLAADSGTRLYFNPNADYNGALPTAITFRAWDQSTGNNGGQADASVNGGSSSFSAASDTAALTVAAVNDAPSLSVGVALPSITEDQAVNNGTLVSSLANVATDVDAGALHGIALTGVDNTNGTWQYTLDGTNWLAVGAVSNSAARLLPSDSLARIRFVPNADWNGVTGLTQYRAWDQTSGTAGGTADTSTNGGSSAFSFGVSGSSLSVTAVNDAPVNTVPGGQSLTEDGTLVFSSANGNLISVNDVDVGGGNLQITLAAVNGTLTLSGTTGLSFSVGDGAADASLQFTGTQAAVNAALAGMSFTATPDFNGAASFNLTTNDHGNTGGGALSDSDGVAITVSSVNDAPVNGVPVAQTMREGTTLIFSASTGNQISIADPDAGSSAIRVTLAAVNGTLSLSGTTGLAFTVGDGTNDASMTFTGTLADINAALNGAGYYATPNVSGGGSIQITTNDQGNSGTGGSLGDVDSIAVDIKGFVITPLTGLTTTEAGGGASFTIALRSAPTANVSLNLSSSDATEGGVGPASVTFTASNWFTAQTVTLTGVNDAVADGDVTYSVLTSAAVSGDAYYNNLDPADVAVTNLDDDSGGIVVSAISGTTTEIGGTATFSIVLNSQPTADVTIALSSGVPTEASLSVNTVTFTAANWNVARFITVTGVDDFVIDGDTGFTIVTAAATSGDTTYNGMNAADVAGVNLDNDAAGFTISALSGATTEAGGIATFTVVLNSQPTADVTIGLSSGDLTEATVGVSSLTFTALNWNIAQTVTVTGVDDYVADGDTGFAIVTAAATSGDAFYNGVNAADVAGVNLDNDTAGFTISALSGATTEAGGIATFTIVLNSQPTADVTIGLSSGDPTEVTVGVPSVTFTALNWNIAQTVTVTGVNDYLIDGDITATILTAAAVSADANYNGQNALDVAVVNTDDDASGIIVSAVIGGASEAGGTAKFTVVLTAQPTAPVTIAVSSGNVAEGVVNTNALIFTSSNWNAPQLVTVTGVDDAVDDGDQVFTVVLSPATSGDLNFAGLDAADIVLVNTDDDSTPTLDLDPDNSGGIAGNDYQVVFAEDGAPVLLADVDALLADADGSPIQSLQILLTNPLNGSAETLAADTAGTSIAAVFNPTTGVLLLTGNDTAAHYQQVLRTVTYHNASPNPSVADRVVTFTVTDGVNTGAVAMTTIAISASNDAPTAIIPAVATVTEDSVLTFSSAGGNGVLVTDVDDSVLQVSITAGNGLLTLAGSAGLTFSTGDGVGDATLVFQGTQAALNAALDGLTYTPAADLFGSDTILFVVRDSTGASFSGDIAVQIDPASDAPTLTLPLGTTGAEDSIILFSSAGGNAITIFDADGPVELLDVSLSFTDGVATLATTAGLIFTSGDGSADAAMTFRGTQADINAALDGLAFLPLQDVNGLQSGTITVTDGTLLSAAGQFTINVLPVNDAPIATGESFSTFSSSSFVLGSPGLLANDTDVEGDTLSIQILTQPAHGVLVAAGDGSFTFIPDVTYFGGDSFTYLVSDGAAVSSPVTVQFEINFFAAGGSSGGSSGANDNPAAPTDSGADDSDTDTEDGSATAPSLTALQGSAASGTAPRPAPTTSSNTSDDVAVQAGGIGGGTASDGDSRGQGPTEAEGAAESNHPGRHGEAASAGKQIRFASLGFRERSDSVAAVTVEMDILDSLLGNLRDELKQDEEVQFMAATAAGTATAAFSAGYAIWTLKSGHLLASLLGSLPAWKNIDPLPILESRQVRGGRDDGDDETLAEIASRDR